MRSDLPAPVDLEDLLEPFSRRGVDLGLHRLQAALADGGDPQRRFPAVQVAGTNGKGSICTFLHAILRAAGLRVASYRSPHLVSWCERCLIGDDWITPEQLRQDLSRWQAIGRRHGLTPFEMLTAAAFDRFAASGLDLVILEVGLGGRLDATTAHPQRPVLGFASIGLDHREHLGDTLAAIAAEKAGVMAAGAEAFSAPQEPEVAAVLEREAQSRGCRLHWLEPLPPPEEGGPRLGLAGQWQRRNAAVAVAMAQALAAQGWPIGTEAIPRGLAAARWPGRLERRRWRGRELLLDGAHNPPAAVALARELTLLDGEACSAATARAIPDGRPDATAAEPAASRSGDLAAPLAGLAPVPRRWLLGIQRHKQAPEMLRALLRRHDRARITTIPGHSCWDVTSLAEAVPELADRLEAGASLERDLDWLIDTPDGRDGLLRDGVLPVVAGSLHLLGEVMPLLDQPGPAAGAATGGQPKG